jgi:3'-5' exonuclease
MFKTIKDNLWAFDVEWVPDQLAGRLLYGIEDVGATERQIFERMWAEGGATAENPQPFLKTVACRVVSIAALERRAHRDGVTLRLLALPRDASDPEQASERHILSTFLNAVGEYTPQLVGFNSSDADLKILIQRALTNRIQAVKFNSRPNKPWEGIDYYARDNDCHIDIKQVVSAWGKGTPSLHEIATLCGVPGKMDMDGDAVADAWLSGNHQKIVDYNECDAVTTFLVWLRLAYFGGKISAEQYEYEEEEVRELLMREATDNGKEHLGRYLDEWHRLESIIEQYDEASLFAR